MPRVGSVNRDRFLSIHRTVTITGHSCSSMLAARNITGEPVRFKFPMAAELRSTSGLKAEHRSAKNEGVAQRRSFYIFDDIRQFGLNKKFAYFVENVGFLM